jgi:hypothetical protein
MSWTLANFLSSGETKVVALGGIAIAALGAWGVRAYINSRPTAAEIERRRRNELHSRGKMGDGTLLEYHEHFAVYSYDIAGVEYTASQDLSDLQPLLPADIWTTIGPVCIKYDPRNPANSMVFCEEWSGLRIAQPRD